MRAITTLLFSAALACGVWRSTEATKTKHFETVHSWSEIDFVFTDEATRTAMKTDGGFVPGAALPMGLKVDGHTGRIFVTTTKIRPGIPFTLSTVSDTKNAKGENMLLPYPDHSMHTKGCDGFTSVESITIDECGRLWVVDMGAIYTKGLYGGFTQICPAKIFVYDLKTDHLVKTYTFPESFVDEGSSFSAIVADVISTDNECRDTFAYIADISEFGMVVYDYAHDDGWVIDANAFYPYPEFGHFHYKGVHFDGMYGLFGMALTPKHEGHDRTLYFNSMASGKDSYVSTSVLKNKTYSNKEMTHDVGYALYSNIHTWAVPRPGGQACMGPIVNDVMFYGSYHESTVYCWNHKTPYVHDNIVEVAKDEEAFGMFSEFAVATPDGGVPHLYVMSNSFENFFFHTPSTDEIHFHLVKAPVNKLIEGTACAGAPTTT